MPAFPHRSTFGASGLQVSPLGLGSSYGLSGREVERAFDQGVNLMFWGMRRRGDFAKGLRAIAKKDRDGMVLCAQTYSRAAALVAPSVESVLRTLKTSHLDVLCVAWWDEEPPERILDAARVLREAGKIRTIMLSGHHRPNLPLFARVAGVDSIMVRYNAGHPGAEKDVFPLLPTEPEDRAGVLAFTATRWGTLLDPKLMPKGERTPRASDCYRFALSSPHVHATLCGVKDASELTEALCAMERGPLTMEERSWMLRVGAHVKERHNSQGMLLGALDRVKNATCQSTPATHAR
jgi:aryl-alcohol dehydrogenase-like predicted oxidoreductase